MVRPAGAVAAAGLLTRVALTVPCALAQGLRDVPSSYVARDRDPCLTAIARTALPIIASLARYRAEHGRCPTLQDRAEFAALLPPGTRIGIPLQDGFELTQGEPAPWMYEASAQNPAQCSLSKKLGWDPDLVYRIEGASARWFFSPGDGSDDRPLDLDP
ncbi:MAG: hypothetical protein JOZ40_10795 [Methylobacteriaceae bacterium]|nr:hypothetical protein [Methylobacteriaceae bacterium]